MVEIEYIGKQYDVDVGEIKNICKLFFETRFNRQFNPIVDSYANEWLQRFIKGYAWRYMDAVSKKVYTDLILSVGL